MQNSSAVCCLKPGKDRGPGARRGGAGAGCTTQREGQCGFMVDPLLRCCSRGTPCNAVSLSQHMHQPICELKPASSCHKVFVLLIELMHTADRYAAEKGDAGHGHHNTACPAPPPSSPPHRSCQILFRRVASYCYNTVCTQAQIAEDAVPGMQSLRVEDPSKWIHRPWALR